MEKNSFTVSFSQLREYYGLDYRGPLKVESDKKRMDGKFLKL